jgi:hypothetical protein
MYVLFNIMNGTNYYDFYEYFFDGASFFRIYSDLSLIFVSEKNEIVL